ncbi:amino acid ABC transporter permease [Aerococcus agrisoli]|uniref:Amino acid ABC transporter permease n=1 Tax=Aerococcus agrisoli TaxID=2487350 RepID=A0A3N4GHR9_9LACT|nr:amino acid ABC transporter permease [Aerococcus agrisoli]RPA58671.1 amino acid ABC transporter permease [Aerococcus agrisoli]
MLNIFTEYSDLLIEGFINTLIASVIALVCSLIVGGLIGILQTTDHKWLSGIANVYVEFFRNIPLLIIVMFFYVVVPLYGVDITGFQAGVIGLTLYTSSFIADVIRSGIEAVPRGQMEAAISQGMTYVQAMRFVVLPQAVKIVIPPLGNQFINLVKNSSILAMVAGLDLMYYGDLIASQTFNTLGTYTVVALVYLIITVPLTVLVSRIEKNLKQQDVR